MIIAMLVVSAAWQCCGGGPGQWSSRLYRHCKTVARKTPITSAQYRLADIIYQLSLYPRHTRDYNSNNNNNNDNNSNSSCGDNQGVPAWVRQQLQSLQISELSAARALAELHRLFDKKRTQIVAMWAVENPTNAWDQASLSF